MGAMGLSRRARHRRLPRAPRTTRGSPRRRTRSRARSSGTRRPPPRARRRRHTRPSPIRLLEPRLSSGHPWGPLVEATAIRPNRRTPRAKRHPQRWLRSRRPWFTARLRRAQRNPSVRRSRSPQKIHPRPRHVPPRGPSVQRPSARESRTPRRFARRRRRRASPRRSSTTLSRVSSARRCLRVNRVHRSLLRAYSAEQRAGRRAIRRTLRQTRARRPKVARGARRGP